jgi:hypothetical protein
LTTLANVFEWKIFAEVAAQIRSLEKIAVERIRAARAALVHKHQITMLANPGIPRSNIGRVFRCR